MTSSEKKCGCACVAFLKNFAILALASVKPRNIFPDVSARGRNPSQMDAFSMNIR
jgi:hypothetical protein